MRYPLRIRQYSLRDGSGGAGRYRGGLGGTKIFQATHGDVVVSIRGSVISPSRGDWQAVSQRPQHRPGSSVPTAVLKKFPRNECLPCTRASPYTSIRLVEAARVIR